MEEKGKNGSCGGQQLQESAYGILFRILGLDPDSSGQVRDADGTCEEHQGMEIFIGLLMMKFRK